MTIGQEAEVKVDVLIVTAVKDEWDAVLAVDTGAVPGSAWQKGTEAGPEVVYRDFSTGSATLRIAVVQAFGMGRELAVIAATPLLERHPEIRCLAMCGVCAGRRGEVNLGDVIIADRSWPYDAGKVKVTIDEQGHRTERFRGDTELYRIYPPEWKQLAERFQPDPEASWIKSRPRSYEEQGDWVLERLAKNEDPGTHVERREKCMDWSPVLKQLWTTKRLEDGQLTLTQTGNHHIRRRMLLEPDGFNGNTPFKVVVGPIASGAPVVEDPTIFDRLSDSAAMRKVIGLEMETSAILALAYLKKVPYAVVMKGVMDHADPFKSDNMKPFAAQASAQCLIAFLQQHLPPCSKPQKKDPLDYVLEPGTSPLPKFASPAALLNARHAIVPFLGRTDLLGALHAWCDAEEGVRTRLVYGPGGMGKTRLMIELCQQMRKEGWRTGFVPKRISPESFADLVASNQSTLAVIDYAESRAGLRSLLSSVLRRRNFINAGKLRIVLLSRVLGDWWESELQSDVADLLRDETPLALLPLSAPGEERDEMYRLVVERFAAQREVAIRVFTVPPLDDPKYDRVLYIQMAALASVDGLTFSAHTLMDCTLDHEEHFWSQKFEPQKDLDERILRKNIRRVVAALTLRGGVEEQRIAETLVEKLTGGRNEALAMFLRDIYPGEETGDKGFIAGLEPDLLGEAIVFRVLKSEGANFADVLDKTFEGASNRAIRTGFEVLGRLSAAQSEAEKWIGKMLDSDLQARAVTAVEAAKAVGEQTAYSRLGVVLAKTLERDGTSEIAASIDSAGLPRRTVSLAEVALWVTRTLLKKMPDDREPNTLLERARLLGELSDNQNNVGFLEAALASGQEAVLHYRTLTAKWPELFTVDLAMSLSSLGRRYAELGKFSAGLAATQEGVELIRTLASADPDAFRFALAYVLADLSARHAEVGHRQEALVSIEEGVLLDRSLATEHPKEYMPHLASGLLTLGLARSEVGQREASLTSTTEAVALYRQLAQENPDGFLSGLAISLNNLGKMHSEGGDPRSAVVATQESLAIRRKLAQDRPDVFLPDVALNLMNLGNQFRRLGNLEGSLQSAHEAASIYRKLVAQRRDPFLHELARCLMNLGAVQSDAGQSIQALESTNEALEIFRDLAAAQPNAYLPSLASALNNLSVEQKSTGNCVDALESAKEAANIYRKMVVAQGDMFRPWLAKALIYVGSICVALGKLDDALTFTLDGVQVRREIRGSSAEAIFLLGSDLSALAERQWAMGQRDAAIDSYHESIELLRSPVEGSQAERLVRLAMAQSNLSARYVENKRPDLAIGFAIEGIDIFQKLPSDVRQKHLDLLAAAFNHLSACQTDLARHTEALDSAQQALSIMRETAKDGSDQELVGLSAILANLSERQSFFGRYKDALVSSQEAFSIVWPLFVRAPRLYARTAALVLQKLFWRRAELRYPITKELIDCLKFFEHNVGCPAIQMRRVYLPDGSHTWEMFSNLQGVEQTLAGICQD